MTTVIGPTDCPYAAEVIMTTGYEATVSWHIPLLGRTGSELTSISNDHEYITWLVAKNVDTSRYFALAWN